MSGELRVKILLLAALVAALGWFFLPLGLVATALTSALVYSLTLARRGRGLAIALAALVWAPLLLLVLSESVTIGVRGEKIADIGAGLDTTTWVRGLSVFFLPVVVGACLLGSASRRPRLLAGAALAVWLVLVPVAVLVGMNVNNDPQSVRDELGLMGELAIISPAIIGYLLLLAAAIDHLRDERRAAPNVAGPGTTVRAASVLPRP